MAQGNHTCIEKTDIIEFINHLSVSTDRKLVYDSFMCDHRPLKDETWMIRLVVRGNKLPYDADSGSPATDLLEKRYYLIVLSLMPKKGQFF